MHSKRLFLGLFYAGSLVLVYWYARTTVGHADALEVDISDTGPAAGHVASYSESRGDVGDSMDRVEGPIRLPLDELLYLEDRGARIYQFEKLVEALDADSVAAFMDELNTLPKTQRRDGWINRVMEKWGELDPQAAAAYIEEVPGKIRTSMMSQLVNGWARVDPVNAWEYYLIKSNGGSMGTGISGFGILKETVKSNPELVFSFINQVEDHRLENIYLSQISRFAAEAGNFNEVAEVLLGIPDPKDREQAMYSFWREWASYDREGAMQQIETLPAGADRATALQQVMAGWASQNPQEAIAYCTTEIPEADRAQALKEVIKVWAESGKLEEAAAFVQEMPVSVESDDAVRAILWQMSLSDPEGALGWVNSLQNVDRIKAGENTVIMNWAQRDYDAAEAYVLAQDFGDARDDNIRTLFWSKNMLGGGISESVYPLLAEVSDPGMRDDMVIGLAKRAIVELPSYANLPNNVDRDALVERITELDMISDEARDEAISLIRGTPKE